MYDFFSGFNGDFLGRFLCSSFGIAFRLWRDFLKRIFESFLRILWNYMRKQVLNRSYDHLKAISIGNKFGINGDSFSLGVVFNGFKMIYVHNHSKFMFKTELGS